MPKSPFNISLQSRTNLVALASVAGGLFKLFFPEHANFEGDPLMLVTTGLMGLYIRESVGAKDKS